MWWRLGQIEGATDGERGADSGTIARKALPLEGGTPRESVYG